MIRHYHFITDPESRKLCDDIVETMRKTFNIDEAEALGRMNRLWEGGAFLGPDDMIHHEDAVFWAKNIYYGAGSFWWLDPPGLKPLPFP